MLFFLSPCRFTRQAKLQSYLSRRAAALPTFPAAAVKNAIIDRSAGRACAVSAIGHFVVRFASQASRDHQIVEHFHHPADKNIRHTL